MVVDSADRGRAFLSLTGREDRLADMNARLSGSQKRGLRSSTTGFGRQLTWELG